MWRPAHRIRDIKSDDGSLLCLTILRKKSTENCHSWSCTRGFAGLTLSCSPVLMMWQWHHMLEDGFGLRYLTERYNTDHPSSPAITHLDICRRAPPSKLQVPVDDGLAFSQPGIPSHFPTSTKQPVGFAPEALSQTKDWRQLGTRPAPVSPPEGPVMQIKFASAVALSHHCKTTCQCQTNAHFQALQTAASVTRQQEPPDVSGLLSTLPITPQQPHFSKDV